jgi:hypothetical protein
VLKLVLLETNQEHQQQDFQDYLQQPLTGNHFYKMLIIQIYMKIIILGIKKYGNLGKNLSKIKNDNKLITKFFIIIMIIIYIMKLVFNRF